MAQYGTRELAKMIVETNRECSTNGNPRKIEMQGYTAGQQVSLQNS